MNEAEIHPPVNQEASPVTPVNPINPETQPETQLQPFYSAILPDIFAKLDTLLPVEKSNKIDQLNAIVLGQYLEARKAHGLSQTDETDEAQATQEFVENLYSPDWPSNLDLETLNLPIGNYPGFSVALKSALNSRS